MIKDLESFIEKANHVHNNKYDYSMFHYTKSSVKSTIICSIHGEFLKNPNKHLNGQGCPICAFKKSGETKTKNSLKTLVERFHSIHNFKYTYELNKDIIVKAKEKIKIQCELHGIFYQTIDSHLSGNGCKKCGNLRISEKAVGFNEEFFKEKSKKPNKPLMIYILKIFNEQETFIKIGITFDLHKRFNSKQKMPYSYEIIGCYEDTVERLFNFEKYLKKGIKMYFKEFKYKPMIKFGGYTECYNIDILSIFEKNAIRLCKENNWTTFDEFKD